MQTIDFSHQRRFNQGFLAGLGAGIVASLLMLLLSVTVGGISLPEVMGSFFTQILPPTAFDYLHQAIGGDAKHYLFYGIFVGQCLVFALSGGLCNLLVRSTKSADKAQLSWRIGVVLALILWLATGLIFLPLTGAGFFGAGVATGVLGSMLSLAVVGLVFGFLFVALQNRLAVRFLQNSGTAVEPQNEQRLRSRRVMLRGGLVALGVVAVGAVAWRFVITGSLFTSAVAQRVKQQFKNKIVPAPVPNYGTIQPVAGLSSEVTPIDQFYQVSKNIVSDPTVNGATWSLSVTGAVAQPYTLNYQQLMALPMQQQYESLMCVSNEVGGPYMGNALWEGIRLETLLNKAGGVKPGATKVVLYAADDYSDSIHLAKALEPTTVVAVHMDGATLPQERGYPARLLVPGIYGMKHVKWITKIEVTDQDYQGYWQNRGWSDAAPIKMTSRIDTPRDGMTLKVGQPTYVAGVAFSGNKGISEVDVSLDGGRTWNRALLKKPLSQLTWVLWELPWTPPKAGNYAVVVRAVDLQGNVQDPTVASPLPDGSSGYHIISVTVQ
ncbi:MAG TPA: molybdopterin-dependent oxidoreductase [Ktedonobacteraceae bacterium]|nr:molybdopterin-dependent oxidoreductase [Ktedonobacteraceae bacterium]